MPLGSTNSNSVTDAQTERKETLTGFQFTFVSYLTPRGSFQGVIERRGRDLIPFIYGLPPGDAYRDVWKCYRDLQAGWHLIVPIGRPATSFRKAKRRVEAALRAAEELDALRRSGALAPEQTRGECSGGGRWKS